VQIAGHGRRANAPDAWHGDAGNTAFGGDQARAGVAELVRGEAMARERRPALLQAGGR
jgi:hypothetical protein